MAPPPPLSTNSAALHLRLGTRWLREQRGAPRDRVGLELHGLDLLAGASDELLVPLVQAWLEALSVACAGAPWTSVEFPGAGWHVAMERTGEQEILLHRVDSQWGDPGRGPVQLDLGELCGALVTGGNALLRDVQGTTGASADTAGMELALVQLRGAPILPPRTPREVSWPRAITAGSAFRLRWTGGPDRGAVQSGDPGALELVSGRLEFHAPGRLVRVDGARLLPIAHALVDAAEELAHPGAGPVQLLAPPGLRFQAGEISGPGFTLSLAPGELARTLNAFAHDAAALFIETHPPCARLPSIERLLARTTEALAAPLPVQPLLDASPPLATPARGTGRPLAARGRALKRLAFERAWTERVPGAEHLAPGPHRTSLAWGQTGFALLSSRGERVAALTGAEGLSVSPGGDFAAARMGDGLLGLQVGGTPPSRTTWRRQPSTFLPRGWLHAAGSSWCLLAAGRGPCGISALTGRELWRIPSRGGAWFTGAHGRCWMTTESGSLLQLHPATGAIGAAVHGPIPHVGPASAHGRRLSAVATNASRSELTVVDAHSGEVLLRRPVSLGHVGPALPHDRRWFLAGLRGDAWHLLALTPAGRSAWERPLPGAGPWRLAACAAGILATNRAGAAVCVERTGKIRWTAGSSAPDESEAPIPPVVRRGVAFALGPQVRALDARSGEPLAELPLAAPAREAWVDPDLHVRVLDQAGNVTAWSLGTHLSAVRTAPD